MLKWLKRSRRRSRRRHPTVSAASPVTWRLRGFFRNLGRDRAITRRLNFKLLIVLVAAVALLGVGVHFLHAYQVKRNAGTLLAEARRADEKADHSKAHHYLRLYLSFVPDDADAFVRYAELTDKLQTPADGPPTPARARLNSLGFLEKAVQQKPGRNDLRQRVVELAMGLGRFPEAAGHLEVLLRASPENGDLLHRAAQCAAETNKTEEATRLLEQATKHAPGQIDSWVLLARLYGKLSKPVDADTVMREMMEHPVNAKNPRAYLAHARYLRDLGNQRETEADQALAQAREKVAGDDPDVLIASAELELSRRNLKQAREYLTRGLKAHPKHAGLYRALGYVELRDGKPDEAVKCLQDGMKEVEKPDDLLPVLAEALIEANKPAEAEPLIAKLRDLKANPMWIEYLEARILILKGQWVEGARALQRVRPALPSLAYPINLLLVRCYQQMGNTERRLDACRLLLQADRQGVTPALELGAALLAAGRTDEAREEFLRVAAHSPVAKLRAAQLLGVAQMRKPVGERDWTKVEQYLAEAADALPQAIEVPLLRAQVLAAQGKEAEARKVVEAALAQQPQRVELHLALAALVGRIEGPEKARLILEKAGDHPEVQLARALTLIAAKPDEARKALEALERGLGALPQPRQISVLQGLAAAYGRLGDQAEVERLWRQLAERRPHDLPIRLSLFDAARRAGDAAAMKSLLDDIRRIDGPDGPYWHQGEAARLLALARRGDALALAQARKHVDEATRLLAESPRAYLLRAELKELEKDIDGALAAYEQAIKLGDNRTEVIRRTVQLLYAKREYAKANLLFKTLQEQAALTGDLGRWAAEASLQTHDYDAALKLARQAVSNDSKDYRHQLWLGQMLAALGKRDEAEAALRRAVELGEQAPDTWVTLVQFLAATDVKKAEDEIERARTKLPPEFAPLALAFCYEAAGKVDRAAEQYQKALADKPGDPRVVRTLILFHQRRGEYAKAEPHLRKILAPGSKAVEAEQVWARRELALGLALAGEQAKFEEALNLIDQNRTDGQLAVEDQRVRAVLLSTRPGRRKEAIRLLEDLSARQTLAPDDRFRLAQLYDAVDDWEKAEDHLVTLAAADRPSARHLAYFTHGLLKRNSLAKAKVYLGQLDKLDAEGFATLSAKARLAAAEQRGGEAAELVKKYVKEKPAFLGAAAALLEELRQLPAAEEMFRQFVAQSKQPEGVFVLVRFLARQQKLDEALALCAKAWENCRPEAVASVCVAALRGGKASAEQRRRVEPWLEKALAKDPASITLLLTVADFRELQERHADAQLIYREVLKKQDRNIIALNNLAWLLSLKDGKGDEALKLIEDGMKVAGPLPELLDTRGVVHLGRGQGDLAVKDLKDAIDIVPTATRYYHLALAYHLTRDIPSAREALEKAKTLGLEPGQLHPLERNGYQKLIEQLPQQ